MMNRLQIEQEIVRILEKITGVQNSNIRISYQTSGMPFIEADTDYIFVSLSFFETDYVKPIEISFDAEKEQETYKSMSGIVANLVFYGLNAFENAQKVKVMTTDSSITKNLRAGGVYLIANTAEPRRVPILINQQWFNQVYLDLRFYQKIMYNIDRHYIDSTEIKVITDHKEETINIEKGGN